MEYLFLIKEFPLLVHVRYLFETLCQNSKRFEISSWVYKLDLVATVLHFDELHIACLLYFHSLVNVSTRKSFKFTLALIGSQQKFPKPHWKLWDELFDGIVKKQRTLACYFVIKLMYHKIIQQECFNILICTLKHLLRGNIHLEVHCYNLPADSVTWIALWLPILTQ